MVNKCWLGLPHPGAHSWFHPQLASLHELSPRGETSPSLSPPASILGGSSWGRDWLHGLFFQGCVHGWKHLQSVFSPWARRKAILLTDLILLGSVPSTNQSLSRNWPHVHAQS